MFIYFFSYFAGATAVPPSERTTLTSGYVDIQYTLGRGNVDLNGLYKRDGEGNSFSIYQGSLMLNDSFDSGEFVLDIPFRTTTTNPQQTNSLELATQEAQAFIEYEYSTSVFWRLGQFDSFYGLEENDTTEIFFPRKSGIFTMTPTTQTGFLVGWTNTIWKAQFVIGNADQVGKQNPNDTHEVGAQLGWQNKHSSFDLSFLMVGHRGNYQLNGGAISRDRQARLLLSLVGETTFGPLQVGVEGDLVRSQYDKAYSNGTLKSQPFGYGFLVQAMYNVTEQWGVGFRYDYSKDDNTNEFVEYAQTQGGTSNTFTGYGGHLSKLAFGVRRVINEQLTAKVGYETSSVNIGSDASGLTRSFNSGTAALLYTF